MNSNSWRGDKRDGKGKRRWRDVGTCFFLGEVLQLKEEIGGGGEEKKKKKKKRRIFFLKKK